jgi:hypothetical protein
VSGLGYADALLRVAKLEAALKDIASNGTRHDLTPTRRLHPHNDQAMEVDEWWNSYLISADKAVRSVATKALES